MVTDINKIMTCKYKILKIKNYKKNKDIIFNLGCLINQVLHLMITNSKMDKNEKGFKCCGNC